MKKILWSFLVAVIALCNIGYAESTNGIVLPQIVTETVDSGGKLLFSDSPEYVKKNGVLYADTVQGEARVLYYHLNDSDMSRKFGVVVENITGKPVTVTVKQWGDGTPIADDYLVLGKETQTAYFSHHTPYHLKLEPGEKRLLAASMDERVVGAQELVYGVYDFFADGEVKVTVLAYPVTADPCRFLRIARIQPADELHLRGTFDNMNRVITVRHPLDLQRNGAACLVLVDDEADKYRRGVDALDGSAVVNQGNYGIKYWLDIPISGSGKSKYILTPLGGVYAGAMRVHSKQQRSRLVLTPQDKVFFGDIPLPEEDADKQAELLHQGMGMYFPYGEQTLLGEFSNDDRVLLEFSPPGASNLPVSIIILPVQETKRTVPERTERRYIRKAPTDVADK